MVGIEVTDGVRSLAQLLRHAVHFVECFLALAHIDRIAHAVRRGDRVMFVIDQDQLVARVCVGEANSAGTGPVSNPPHRALRRQRLVGFLEKQSDITDGKPRIRKVRNMLPCC